jgi:hypothetical protein
LQFPFAAEERDRVDDVIDFYESPIQANDPLSRVSHLCRPNRLSAGNKAASKKALKTLMACGLEIRPSNLWIRSLQGG